MNKLKRVVIKQELVELTEDYRAALILNQFIYWTERMRDTDKYILEERERAYLVIKYFEFEKGDSFENVKSKLDKEGLEIKDSNEFESEAGYKKREVSVLDSENELNLVFRDDKLASKTFTYNKDDVSSTWFYSNYYDVLEGKDQEDEKHGIWKESKKEIECMDEYDLNIKLQDEI